MLQSSDILHHLASLHPHCVVRICCMYHNQPVFHEMQSFYCTHYVFTVNRVGNKICTAKNTFSVKQVRWGCIDNLRISIVKKIFCGHSLESFQQSDSINEYRKNPKISDTRKFAVITLKVEQDGFSLENMQREYAEGITNSVDPDHTAPLGAVWSGSALFAQTCLSENLGTLRYSQQMF